MLLLTKGGFDQIKFPQISNAADQTVSSSLGGSASVQQPATVVHSSSPPAAASEVTEVAADAAMSFPEGVLSCLKGDLRGCCDVARLLEGASLVVQLCSIEEISDKALQVALVLLVNRYPKVS
jgi:hypothetical protein